ncbi:MAG: hypothetical protein QOE90_1862 [Thermoplasmata archaeon]|jgi:hypothetical protein|nr:hypothetical protein [Thermoplasmata archaeon]
MIARPYILVAALLMTLPLSTAATPAAPFAGAAATLLYDGSGGTPQLIVGEGWSCTPLSGSGTSWSTDCSPAVGSGVALGVPTFCQNPEGIAGGTPVSFGTATVTLSCGTGPSTSCTLTKWVISGECDTALKGGFAFPLHCNADVTLTVIGAGRGYAECGNGDAAA